MELYWRFLLYGMRPSKTPHTKLIRHWVHLFVALNLTIIILLNSVNCSDHGPHISLKVICFTFFRSIYLALSKNQQKWLNDSHLWWKQNILLQENQRKNSLTYTVSLIMYMISYLNVNCYMLIYLIVFGKDGAILLLCRKKHHNN